MYTQTPLKIKRFWFTKKRIRKQLLQLPILRQQIYMKNINFASSVETLL